MEHFDEINLHRHLFLTEIADHAPNILRIVLTEGQVRVEAEGPRQYEASDYGAIVADELCASYEVIFDQYVAYGVRNESFTVWDDDEDFVGGLFRVYSKSKFLNYVTAATIASEDYGGPYQHFGFVCEDHILDVACSSEPQINLIRASKRGALRAIPGGA